jgi:hypothetical protein
MKATNLKQTGSPDNDIYKAASLYGKEDTKKRISTFTETKTDNSPPITVDRTDFSAGGCNRNKTYTKFSRIK